MILAITRTLNEEKDIEFYIKNYLWCDAILISDGGSTDQTLEIAKRYKKVIIRHFPTKIPCIGDIHLSMNPENEHFNSLVNDALDLGADWVVYDDTDSAPNKMLHANARAIIENSPYPEVYVRRYYMWYFDKYFPTLTCDAPVDNSLHSFWAWKPNVVNIRGDMSQDPYNMHYYGFGQAHEKYYIPLPMALLHYSWPTEAAVQEKMRRYAAWNRPQNYPADAFGPAEEKLDHMECVYPLEPYYEN